MRKDLEILRDLSEAFRPPNEEVRVRAIQHWELEGISDMVGQHLHFTSGMIRTISSFNR